jgi:hypothetical protein
MIGVWFLERTGNFLFPITSTWALDIFLGALSTRPTWPELGVNSYIRNRLRDLLLTLINEANNSLSLILLNIKNFIITLTCHT